MLAAVTGGTGFIGSVLVSRLARAGHRVRVLARASSDISSFADFPNVEVVRGDLFDSAALRRVCAGADVFFHLAADLSFWRQAKAQQDRLNIEGTRLAMEAARAGRVRRVVYTSSVAALGIPEHPGVPAAEDNPFRGHAYNYLLSKHLAEREALQAVRTLSLDVVAVNPAVVFGGAASPSRKSGSQRIVTLIDKGIAIPILGTPVYPPGGYSVCDVDDVVDGHIAAAERGRTGHRYILAGHNVLLREVFAGIARALGRPIPQVALPGIALLAVGAGSELLSMVTGRMPRITWDYAALGRMRLWYDSSKAVEELGYRIGPFEAAIDKAVNAYRAGRDAAHAAAATSQKAS